MLYKITLLVRERRVDEQGAVVVRPIVPPYKCGVRVVPGERNVA